MDAERWQQIETIYHSALRRPPGEREQYLAEACSGDEALRDEVQTLILQHEKSGSFLDTPVFDLGVEALAEQAALSAGRTVGHYVILEIIGRGGMGEVYLARDPRLGRKVALKLLPEALKGDADRVQRFRQEARAASAVSHPNIAHVYDVGEAEGRFFTAIEYVDGVTLRRLITEKGLGVREAVEIAAQVAEALAAAHAGGVVHRDVKPENVMVHRDGYVKVLDFGLAKLIERLRTDEFGGAGAPTAPLVHSEPGVLMGSVNYMSPEQARGKDVDARTDIWSLGCVLYEMVAGRAPFAGETVTDMLVAIVEKEPPLLKDLAPEPIPAELDRIITKTLRKNPDERYQASKELLTDLQRLRQQLEIETHLERSAPPEAGGAATKARVATRLAPRRGVIIAAVLLALTLGALAYAWRWRQSSVAPRAEIKSLAVLPLKSLDAGEDYLGLGIADAVIRRISQTGELIVRPTSAVRRYLNEDTDAITAARQLSADAVLEGSFQRADDRLRVSVSLLRTGDGASLWAESFDMRAADIFTIQDTVAQQVASRLRLRLDPAQQARLHKRSTSNPLAYEYYVRGVHSLDQRGFNEGAKPQMEATISYFKKAIEADPDYALAHAQLANAYIWMAIFIEEQAVWAERAKEEINRADALDPQLAETRVARHWLLGSAYEGWQSEAAVRELLLAQQINPNVGHVELGSIYYHLGLEDLGDRAYQRALDIDPTSEYVQYMTFAHYILVRKYDEWLATYQKFNPNDTPTHTWYLMGKGRLDEAQKRLDELSVKHPDDPGIRFSKAFLSALKGDFRPAEAAIALILSKTNPQNFAYHHLTYDIACLYAVGGKSDEAVKWLRKTAAEGFPSHTLFERDPYLNRIRQEPEFIQFMEEMKAQQERYRREFS